MKKKNKKKRQNNKKKAPQIEAQKTEVIVAEKTFKEKLKEHFLKYRQPYVIGTIMVGWFLLLLIFATAGKKAPYSNVAFKIGSLEIAWYAVFILTGAVFAIILAYREAFFLNMNREHLVDGGLIGILVGIIGARLYYVIFHSVGGFKEIFNLRGGGLAIHGAVIVGIIYVIIYTKIRKMDLFQLLDLLAVGFLVGQIVGRWGNFMNQEAHGGPMSANAQQVLSVILPNFIYNNMIIDGVVYHPTFLYESLWNFVGLILLLIIRRKRIFKVGDMMGLYLMWYGLGRGLLIEPFRTDPLLFVESAGMGNIFNRVNVVFSLTLFLIGGLLYIIVKNKIKPDIPYYYDVVLENKEEALYLLSKEGRQKRREEKNK